MNQLQALLGFVAVTAVLASGARAQEPGRLEVFTAGSSPFDTGYAEWFARWTKWAFEAPKARNPLLRPRDCEASPQPGKRMWFLSASSGGRHTVSCTIAQGRPIYVPLAGTVCTPEGKVDTPAELRRDCAVPTFRQLSVLRASFDGEPLVRPRRHRFITRPFTLDVPRNNIFGGPAGKVLALGAGYAAIIRPPAPGRYTVETYAEFVTPGEPVFKAGMTYRLTIE